MEHLQTILIVEDDDALLRMLERTLNLEGYWVMTASNGAAALRILDKEMPSLILLDLVLPWVNGLEVLATIRETPRLRSVPVLIVTGMPVTMRDVQPYRPIDVIHKPASVEVMIEAIRKLLRIDAEHDKKERMGE